MKFPCLAVCLAAAWLSAGTASAGVQDCPPKAESTAPVVIEVDGWDLRGDFQLALGARAQPVALLLNKANGNRQAYAGLAAELARRGVGSLRLDLRGHGDSVNLGRFVPGAPGVDELLAGSEHDIAAALAWLERCQRADRHPTAVVGASYSGELMAQAARDLGRAVEVYVALSPGSLSEESVRGMDPSGARWLVVRAERERSPSVRAAAEAVIALSRTGEVWVLDAGVHATDLLAAVSDLNSRLADWIAAALAAEGSPPNLR